MLLIVLKLDYKNEIKTMPKKIDFDEYFIKKDIDEQLKKSFETEIEIISE